MALANFFDKIHFGAAQILNNYDRSAFETKLLSNCVGVSVGTLALQKHEGRIALDLLTRLLARLYPNIKFTVTGTAPENEDQINKLKGIAKEINPNIRLDVDQEETFLICLDSNPVNVQSIPTFYLGSDNWKAFHSTTIPQKIGESQNPFGAAAAVCIACSNLFRSMFADELGGPSLDENVCFSTYSQTIQPCNIEPAFVPEISINFTLIGAGAIGNAALWAFSQMPYASGEITLVDKEPVALSNLQRYVLMMQNNKDQSKVEVMRQIFQDKNSRLNIQPIPFKWQKVIGKLQKNQLQLVATAIDTKVERLLLQSALPKKIINAWTSPECVGISRHFDFVNEICLSCLYLPTSKEKSESEKIADALNMSVQERFIREYLAQKKPVDERFITVVSEIGKIDRNKLSFFKNQPVQVLYSDGICGGGLLSMRTDSTIPQDMEVPLAHESALAGVLLAAEVVIDSLNLRTEPIEPLTKLNLMRPLHKFSKEDENKSFSGRCICQDNTFQKRYEEKWMDSEDKENPLQT